MMKLRSQYVPEGIRATTLNLFRVPLNLFVCLVLYNVRCLLPYPALPLHAPPAMSPACWPHFLELHSAGACYMFGVWHRERLRENKTL